MAPYSGTTLRGKLSVQWPTNPNAVGYLEYEQDVSEPTAVAAVGGEYRLAPAGRLYGRYEFLSSLGSLYSLNDTQQRYTGLFGFDTQYMKDGSVFSEYRMNDAMDRSAQAAVGCATCGRDRFLAAGHDLQHAPAVRPRTGRQTAALLDARLRQPERKLGGRHGGAGTSAASA